MKKKEKYLREKKKTSFFIYNVFGLIEKKNRCYFSFFIFLYKFCGKIIWEGIFNGPHFMKIYFLFQHNFFQFKHFFFPKSKFFLFFFVKTHQSKQSIRKKTMEEEPAFAKRTLSILFTSHNIACIGPKHRFLSFFRS